MVDRPNRPAALTATSGLPPQAQVIISDDNTHVSALLPSGESVEVLLFGATILSWKDAAGEEKLWLSEGSNFDGSKGVRGGIPIVFPLFGPPNIDHPPTSKLPQHGFARTARWEFLGKSTSEGPGSSVKLDFGLSSENLGNAVRAAWPHKFGLLYSVTLDRGSLNTTLVVSNQGNEAFEFQILLHTYLKVKDISSVQLTGLEDSTFADKVNGAQIKTETSATLTISGEIDRVYTPAKGPQHPVVVSEDRHRRYALVRDNLDQVVIWNPWLDRVKGMSDFVPKSGYKNMVCVEAGSVSGWQRLEKSDTFEAAQTIFVL